MSKCEPCEKYRKEMGAAMSKGAFIKAARVAMEAAAWAARGKDKDAEPSAKTGK